jgi:hypothetical protein
MKRLARIEKVCSYTSQTISELMALGAPTRPFIVPVFNVYGALAIAFGNMRLVIGNKDLSGARRVTQGS